jgi:redox-sensing transcriptional repressor
LNELEQTFVDRGISIAIIATPTEAAQEAATRAVLAGARAILNFAPVKLDLPAGVAMREMDVILELQGLCFMVTAANLAAEGIE